VIGFERLDPLVQHHIVNTLGWRELRPLQEISIEPVLRGDNCLLLAPTAGGKTESALFPLLSQMCSQRWAAPGIIYVCPLKALINNLAERLERYTRMLGRSSAIWHGDVSPGERKQARAEPPDILLTTPESLEGMLISTNPQMKAHLRNLQCVVVDEVHAFAGDDRGWHLLCVLERLRAQSGKDFQRIGLSATVGNPEVLLKWLTGTSSRAQTVVQPLSEPGASADVTVDYVGSLENAATVIARLHRGEKRLVFCDSRSRVESLAGLLRTSGVQAFVSHSSLSIAERRRAEEAFARGEDCVIVATSTLELGIDVGDLDRVIQIDAPIRVASFLQRLGRTGRRPGKTRNCLFLCTTERSLLQSAGLLNLWQVGYVEPIIPPILPYHIIAQQAMALCLERGGMGRNDLITYLRRLVPSLEVQESDIANILGHMISSHVLDTDGVRYFIGNEGETQFGRRNYLELVSVFTSAPMLTVTDGRNELGQVDQNLFFSPEPCSGRLLSLAGRGWRVERIDWKDRRVYVTPSESPGKTTWMGTSAGLSLIMCRAIRSVLLADDMPSIWSQRTRECVGDLRQKLAFLKSRHTAILLQTGGRTCWLTFAGTALNLALAEALSHFQVKTKRSDDFAIWFDDQQKPDDIEIAMRKLSNAGAIQFIASNEEAEQLLKYSECLPADLLAREIVARRCAESDLNSVLAEPRQMVSQQELFTLSLD
jgi:ATP-dependent Lhr-like helicase